MATNKNSFNFDKAAYNAGAKWGAKKAQERAIKKAEAAELYNQKVAMGVISPEDIQSAKSSKGWSVASIVVSVIVFFGALAPSNFVGLVFGGASLGVAIWAAKKTTMRTGVNITAIVFGVIAVLAVLGGFALWLFVRASTGYSY